MHKAPLIPHILSRVRKWQCCSFRNKDDLVSQRPRLYAEIVVQSEATICTYGSALGAGGLARNGLLVQGRIDTTATRCERRLAASPACPRVVDPLRTLNGSELWVLLRRE